MTDGLKSHHHHHHHHHIIIVIIIVIAICHIRLSCKFMPLTSNALIQIWRITQMCGNGRNTFQPYTACGLAIITCFKDGVCLMRFETIGWQHSTTQRRSHVGKPFSIFYIGHCIQSKTHLLARCPVVWQECNFYYIWVTVTFTLACKTCNHRFNPNTIWMDINPV